MERQLSDKMVKYLKDKLGVDTQLMDNRYIGIDDNESVNILYDIYNGDIAWYNTIQFGKLYDDRKHIPSRISAEQFIEYVDIFSKSK